MSDDAEDGEELAELLHLSGSALVDEVMRIRRGKGLADAVEHLKTIQHDIDGPAYDVRINPTAPGQPGSASFTPRQLARILIGKRIKERRVALGLTQTQLADRTGQGQGTIAHYEAGRAGVDTGDLVIFCQVLKVPVSYFYQDLGVAAGYEGGALDYFWALKEEHREVVRSLMRVLYDKQENKP